MALVIGMCGKKQSGKNSLCNFIKQLLPDSKFVEFAFAKALKDLAVEVFCIPAKSCFGSDADKNYPIATWGKFFTTKILNKYNKKSDSLLSGRECLQLIGTDVIREHDDEALVDGYFAPLNEFLRSKVGDVLTPDYDFKNIWANILVEDVKRASSQYDVIAISDVRFFNEINAIKSLGGKIVRLHREAKLSNSIPHPSELEMEQMDDSLFDYVLQEEDNVVLNDLKVFAINILMKEGLLGGGVSI